MTGAPVVSAEPVTEPVTEPLERVAVRPRPRRGAWWAGVAVVLAVAGGAAVVVGLLTMPAPPQRVAAADPGPSPGATGRAQQPLGRSVPVRLTIPAIGVDTDLLAVGLAADGTVEVPPLESPLAAWYEYSPTPGELGPAVLLGHVDSARSGPSVFYDLAALEPGDAVTVDRADGSVVAFAVERVERYPKAAFPTADVYGDLPYPGLRLITCGGGFSDGHYLDNVVVYAR